MNTERRNTQLNSSPQAGESIHDGRLRYRCGNEYVLFPERNATALAVTSFLFSQVSPYKMHIESTPFRESQKEKDKSTMRTHIHTCINIHTHTHHNSVCLL